MSELIDDGLDEYALTAAVRDELTATLAAGFDLPEDRTRPDPDRYVMYPLHVDPGGRFSIASAVWNVGQGTPVHGHETWGVVGIYSGVEVETRYAKPTVPDVPLVEERRPTSGPPARSPSAAPPTTTCTRCAAAATEPVRRHPRLRRGHRHAPAPLVRPGDRCRALVRLQLGPVKGRTT